MAEGIRYRLWKTFGWYEANPVNYTRQEVERYNLTDVGQMGQMNDFEERYILGSKDPQAHIKEMGEMAHHDLVQPIIDIYSEESTQPDISEGKSLWYECNDPEIEDNLNDMLEKIKMEDYIYSIAFNLSSTGNDFRRILRNRDGIQQLVGCKNHSVKRLWDPTTRRLLGFRWEMGTPREEDIIFDSDESVFAPWEFLHFRRIADTDTEYGRGLLDHLFALYRKIKMATDQMVMYRLHTMPNRHVIFVDVGNQTVMEAMETINNFRQLMRQNIMIDPSQGTFQSRFDVPSLDSILWLPVRSEETNTKVEEMKGDKDVPDVHDLEYLTKSFYGGARVPKAYVGHGDDSGGLAQASLVSQDIRFARMVRVLRRPLIAGFHRLAQLHLLFQGVDPEQYKIKVRMSKISSIEEEVNAAAMETQINLSRSLVDICQVLEIPNKEIIELVFKEYLHLPRKFIDVAKLAVSINRALGGDQEGEMVGGMGPGMGPSMGGGTELGSLGTDLGLEGGLEDLEGEGGGEEEPKTKKLAASNINSALNLLVEGIVSKRQVLMESKEGEEKKSILDGIRYDLKQIVEDSSKIKTSGKTSLTEVIERQVALTPLDESCPRLDENQELEYSEHRETYFKLKREGLLTEQTEELNESESHPMVQAVKRARTNGTINPTSR